MTDAVFDAEAAILSLLGQRAPGSTICPSEAARVVDADAWRNAMPAVHDAAHRLIGRSLVVLMQGGMVREPAGIVGAYRIRGA